MKLSIAWIFDHIDADWKKQDINKIVSRFNQVTAEIEDYYPINLNLANFALGTITKSNDNSVTLNIPEWNLEATLPARGDSNSPGVFMVTDKKEPRWANCKDFGLDKDGYLPAFYVDEKSLKGEWKSQVETEDIILEVDNKSVTHRPDMWGHRGFAREIAAFMGLNLLPESEFLKSIKVIESDSQASATPTNPFKITNKAAAVCKRFSGLYFPSIENKPSNLFSAFRLMRVGSRSIDALVDLTNYVMLDWAQPTHVFDADKVEDKEIVIRMAKPGEKIKLLDGRDIELTDQDLVIADSKKAMALGGVMGGAEDSMTKETKTVFLESANFDATTIRRTALRHKSRTEASARFEKTQDPNQAVEGIQRFATLADQFGIRLQHAEEILAVGDAPRAEIISVSHDYLEKRAGFELSEKDVIEPLQKLGFTASSVEGSYDITIPTFRGAKDVKNKEDILEEIVRFYGFDNVKLVLPSITMKPNSIKEVMRSRKIKAFFRDSAHMVEQQNYALYDEEFLNSIGYQPKEKTVNLKNPISENNHRMVTSLVPGLLKNVKDNFVLAEELRFFELGRVWSVQGQKVYEQKSVTGIVFNKRCDVNFYENKEHVTALLEDFAVDYTWSKSKTVQPWMNSHQTGDVYFKDKCIGYAGKVDHAFLSKLDVLPESDAFIFSLDADFLLQHSPETTKFKPLSRFQEVNFDLSALMPLKVTVSAIEEVLSGVDGMVEEVRLIDYFEKDDWADQRSLAFRLRISSEEKTLEKDEIESIIQKAIKSLEKLGGTLRG